MGHLQRFHQGWNLKCEEPVVEWQKCFQETAKGHGCEVGTRCAKEERMCHSQQERSKLCSSREEFVGKDEGREQEEEPMR